MDEILSKTHYRRTFFLIVGLLLLISVITRFFVLPYFYSSVALTAPTLLGQLLDNLVVSLLISVFLGGFVFWLTPNVVRRSTIEVVAPKQINPLLKSAATMTRGWVYKGACGRYTRATTLPMLADAARKEGLGRDITICILNPRNDALCESYATYRRSLKSAASGTPWTGKVVKEEVLATAVTALRFMQSEPLLRIRLFFVDHFSAFRFDISDKFVVVTKEDKEASALRADEGTYFYDSYKDDVRLTERQSKEMICCGKVVFGEVVNEQALRDAVRCASLVDEENLGAVDLTKILALINSPADPY